MEVYLTLRPDIMSMLERILYSAKRQRKRMGVLGGIAREPAENDIACRALPEIDQSQSNMRIITSVN